VGGCGLDAVDWCGGEAEKYRVNPCALCGDPDAGHRLRDAIRSRHSAGDAVAVLAEDYGMSVAAVLEILSEAEVTHE
jgi:hypothetical protein